MSYPRLIQPLVIEDEAVIKDSYEDLFGRFAKKHPVARPRFAFSYSDALAALSCEELFHLVVLDLNLPEKNDMPATGDISFGLELLNTLRARDDYPVPATVIVSGNLNRVKSELTDVLRDGFYFGKAANKGVDEDYVLEEAISHIDRYLGVGIHMRDALGKVFPTLSPREEDLLRRCVLDQPHCVGLDVGWWSADRDTSGRWTKVLMGRFIHDEGALGFSRTNFFKFSPVDDARIVIPEAARLEHKLGHIKIIHSRITDTASILVTQKVGDGVDAPTPLADYLRRPHAEVAEGIRGIVSQITRQLELLGPAVPDTVFRRSLLWTSFHQRKRIEQAWELFGASISTVADSLTLAVYDRLAADESRVSVMCRQFTHGDLNITNVALDVESSGTHAFIFDVSGVSRQVSVRDLAMLEVTALLHQPGALAVGLVRECASLYEGGTVPDGALPPPVSDIAANTSLLIQEIRKRVAAMCEPLVYAITVFDVAVGQLEGLTYALGSTNKISVPENAAHLAQVTAKWLITMDPSLSPEG